MWAPVQYVSENERGQPKLRGRVARCLADPGWVAQVSRPRLRAADLSWPRLGCFGLRPALWVSRPSASRLAWARPRGDKRSPGEGEPPAARCDCVSSLTPRWPQQVTRLSPKSVRRTRTQGGVKKRAMSQSSTRGAWKGGWF